MVSISFIAKPGLQTARSFFCFTAFQPRLACIRHCWNHRLAPNTASSRQTFRVSDILPGQARKSSNKYTFEHLAQVTEKFAEALNLRRYTLYLHDYGGPVGMRMAVARPERIEAIIIQNAVSHEEGLSPLWAARRAFWQDRTAHEAAFRKSFLSLETTRNRHLGASPHPERINPDIWTDEYYFLNQPGQADIQTDLFFDYQNNLKAYPIWQKWLRDHQPPMLVLWGRYDSSFLVAGAEAYRKDVPGAEVHILDAGHFALDEQASEVIRLTEAFLKKLQAQ